MTLSIIIVHYKVKKELFALLKSISASVSQKVTYEVIVVDNDEEKTIAYDLKKKFPDVTYIPSQQNKGFGAGNNLGASFAKGTYLFFLNPDTIVNKNCIESLINFLDKNKKVGIAAPLLIDPRTNQPYPLQGTKELTPIRGICALSFINKLFPNNTIANDYWLKDWDKKIPKEVDTIPGTAFMIRKNIFEKIHGFDEHFFLYFEEHDLCNRVKKIGAKIVIIPQATLVHAWGKSTEKSDRNIKQIFSKSRCYYFRKNYGLLWACIVNCFTEIHKETVLFIAILLLGTFLRLYRIQQNFGFDAEIGDNLLDIKNAILTHTLPLKGHPTSHPWLSFGPLFYWIYGPFLWISNFNPLSHVYFGTVLGIVTIIVNYVCIKRMFSKLTALISTFLIAISPLYLFTSRIGRFTFFVPILIYPFLVVFKNILDKKSKNFFLLFFLLGFMFNFHYTPLFLIPTIIVGLIIKKIKLNIKQILQSILGLVIPNIPLLIYDSQHGFEMVKNLTLWIPYRIFGFFGLYPKNNVSQKVLQENALSFNTFFTYNFLPQNTFVLLAYSITFVSILFVFWQLFKLFIQKKPLSTNWLIIILWACIGFLALFIHGDVPLHYFVPLFPLPILLFSLFLTAIWQRKMGKIISVIVLMILLIVNMNFYFSPQWFYQKETKTPKTEGRISYTSLKKFAQFIVKDANGEKFTLQRVGYNDIYDKQFAQNYIYLLWLYGNEPVAKAKLHYTIVEQGKNAQKLLTTHTKQFIVSNTIILKNENPL